MIITSSRVGRYWAATVSLIAMMLPFVGCAGELAAYGKGPEGYRHKALGYRIPVPATGGSGWRRVRVEDADIAYRGPSHALMALTSRCDEPKSPPEVLARQLLFGIRERRVLSSGRVELRGMEGWSQQIVGLGEAGRIEARTVSFVAGGCVFDWMLVAPETLAAIEPVFAGWWRGFELGPTLSERMDAERDSDADDSAVLKTVEATP
jgi:hypothetical protein